MNCGQTCITPDYVMCKPETREKLVEQVKRVVDEFYDGDPKQHPDYCRIVNQRHFDRVSNLINEKKVIVVVFFFLLFPCLLLLFFYFFFS